jgi:hypothetical protein
MIIDKCTVMKLYLLLIGVIGMSVMVYGQTKNDSLYTNFDLVNFKTVDPAVTQKPYQKGYYIRNLPPKKRSKQNIELIKLYSDSSKLFTRKASIINTDYGTLFAFKVMKEPGYEKVLIFADWDYHHDSLLTRNDTLYFKGVSDGLIELVIVYPSKNDTIKIKHGYRNSRYDHLNNSYQPALRNFMYWFPDKGLDEVETYTLVKRNKVYDLIQIDTNRDRKEYEYKDLKEKYAKVGGSPFWLALTELSY